MRKIIFNEETISSIKKFIDEGHSIKETSNRFSIKQDTLRRVMYENDIKPHFVEKRSYVREITDDDVNRICSLYANTNQPMDSICKELKLKNYIVQDIIRAEFSEQYINDRKSRLYRLSKLGDKNPMLGKYREEHPNWKGIIDDGNGYQMVKKPDWYTGRKSSSYVFYHSVVFCEYTGMTQIPKGFVIHHIDRNPKNNDINNLAMMTTSGHSKLHSIENNLCKAQRLSTKE